MLVNIQVFDDLSWTEIFEKMEMLQARNKQVYSYIVSSVPIDYIYNSVITTEKGMKPSKDLFSMNCLKRMFAAQQKIKPTMETMDRLQPFEKKYDITKLKELPWSVIFQR